eukprot:TRINITY_DN1079_c0_g1_i1.p1 TRINITY_DN1079_c0_g1~~TRINITY_DN1079_c0_g1_i1.p1  ORF type:complete len:180 (+),score=39.77 TRINITY_DN1079_c0_g1_i1:399-938(+)
MRKLKKKKKNDKESKSNLLSDFMSTYQDISEKNDDEIISPLENCVEIIKLNNVEENCKVLGLRWGEFSQDVIEIKKLDYVIASDCFYDNTKSFEDIIATISYFIDINPDLMFIFTYQSRSSYRSISQYFDNWNLKSFQIPLNSFYNTESSSSDDDNTLTELLIVIHEDNNADIPFNIIS